MLPLSPDESASLEALANSLNVNKKDLLVLINFESSWNPQARNASTGARGLIQFMPSTAKGMGFRDADDLVAQYPTRKAQLDGPVRKYLSALKPYSGTAQNLFMAVFHPDYRNVPITKPFDVDTQHYNPGIKTPLDYIKRAYAVAGLRYAAPIGAGLILLATTAYFLFGK
jgi:hypothetical protein